ncbi:carbohydrate-binding family 9-like protein [Flavivirga algicola]|uniref:Carbohydrate-binding family 9-like protein n=1 Tax=Flavivirga algicola TaxID=2729136 RepID=A0ABX1RUC6_9FLAO|nr:carbohydrate-binding family 9-like protein [Flavivirga algicola]NMH87136.1 carbohydrate-binding family 9-like protein [Flavivirga algicola]
MGLLNSKYTWVKTISVLFVFVIFILLNNNLEAQNKIQKNIPKTYIANHAKDIINIDGLGNESSWQNAEFSDLFIDIEGVKKPAYSTKFKMLWDESNIYFFAELEDPHIWATLKKRDTIIFHNNDFEIFIDPDGDSHNYYEFEFNALNTLWDLFLTKPYREGNAVLNDWEAKGLKSAVYIDGTLNNPIDTDKKWSIEIAIPLNVFKTSYFENIVLKDHFWRMNFSRVFWEFQIENGKYQRKTNAEGKLLHEKNWVWSPQGVVAMHQPETWGYIYFSPSKTNNKIPFNIPNDEHIKWYLYKLHKLIKNKNTDMNLIEAPTTIVNKIITPKFQTHESGYNIWVKSPFSGQKILITEDGKIMIK